MDRVKSGRDTFTGNTGPINTGSGTIIVGSAPPDAAVLLQQGLKFLGLRAYDQAIAKLLESVGTDPTSCDAQYYLALASLRGRRPKTLTESQARAIEEHLRVACGADGNEACYCYLWALVKFDFFVLNGFAVEPPSIEQLLFAADQHPVDVNALEMMLAHTLGADHE